MKLRTDLGVVFDGDKETPAGVVIRLANSGVPVSTLRARYPRLCAAVLEDVGSWPSSEPAIRDLQRLG